MIFRRLYAISEETEPAVDRKTVLAVDRWQHRCSAARGRYPPGNYMYYTHAFTTKSLSFEAIQSDQPISVVRSGSFVHTNT